MCFVTWAPKEIDARLKNERANSLKIYMIKI